MPLYRYRVITSKDRLYEDEGTASCMEEMLELIRAMHESEREKITLMHVEHVQDATSIGLDM